MSTVRATPANRLWRACRVQTNHAALHGNDHYDDRYCIQSHERALRLCQIVLQNAQQRLTGHENDLGIVVMRVEQLLYSRENCTVNCEAARTRSF